MVVSEVFRLELFNKAFKGYRYDSVENRIEPYFGLDNDSQQSLIDRFVDFGFSTKDEAKSAIGSCLSSRNNELSLRERKVSKLGFVNLPVGAVLVLGKDYDLSLSLLYFGNFRFCVIKDDEHRLKTGTFVQSVEKGVTGGDAVHFWVFENGRFPSNPRKVYSTGWISSICWEPPTPIAKPKDIIKHTVSTKKSVYAWKPTVIENCTVFDARDITDDKNAFFQINLEDCTFGINPEFDEKCLNGRNLFDDFLIPVSDNVVYDIRQTLNVANLRRTTDTGNLKFIDETMCLRVEQKIKTIRL